MRVLMVYPAYPDTFWSFKHALKFVSKKAAFPPLGLLTVASLLPKDWEIKLVDMNTDPLKDEDLKWCDMVFISAMLVQNQSTYEVIKRAKKFNKKVVAGGPAFNAQPHKYPDVDHFILNEAEITLPMFLEDLEKGRELKRIYTSEEKPDITKTPLPMWSLIDFKKYATMLVQYSRGCPFNCEFCDIIIMNGRKPRVKTPQQMVREFQALYDMGWRGSVFIVDDNFIGNKRSVKKMLPEIIKWQKEHNYPFSLLTEASVNLADDEELMRLMAEANFNKVFLGLESPSPESLKECGKYQNVNRDLVEVVNKIHAHGMQVMAGFIVGFDNDTEEIFDLQIDFIQKIGVAVAMVGILGAIPRTRLWKRLKAEGRLLGDTSGDNTDGSTNFIPKMGMEKLLKGYVKVITTIYSPKVYYERIKVFVRNFNPITKRKLKFEDLKALLKSFFYIGMSPRTGFLFWKMIFQTAFTKVKALPAAIELAIFHYHLERIAQKCKRNIEEFFKKEESQKILEKERKFVMQS